MEIYALCDEASLKRERVCLEAFIARAKAAGADILQYRNKIDTPQKVARRLEEIASIFEGRVIVNDYPELASLCDGVHVGQEDLARYGTMPEKAVESLRKIVGEGRWIGLSTHNAEEIEIANGLAIDYIGLGALRSTSTKPEAHVLGKEALSALAKRSRHPVAAIGGVRLDDMIDHVRWLVVGSALYED